MGCDFTSSAWSRGAAVRLRQCSVMCGPLRRASRETFSRLGTRTDSRQGGPSHAPASTSTGTIRATLAGWCQVGAVLHWAISTWWYLWPICRHFLISCSGLYYWAPQVPCTSKCPASWNSRLIVRTFHSGRSRWCGRSPDLIYPWGAHSRASGHDVSCLYRACGPVHSACCVWGCSHLDLWNLSLLRFSTIVSLGDIHLSRAPYPDRNCSVSYKSSSGKMNGWASSQENWYWFCVV